jgi:hypothetical protein
MVTKRLVAGLVWLGCGDDKMYLRADVRYSVLRARASFRLPEQSMRSIPDLREVVATEGSGQRAVVGRWWFGNERPSVTQKIADIDTFLFVQLWITFTQ